MTTLRLSACSRSRRRSRERCPRGLRAGAAVAVVALLAVSAPARSETDADEQPLVPTGFAPRETDPAAAPVPGRLTTVAAEWGPTLLLLGVLAVVAIAARRARGRGIGSVGAFGSPRRGGRLEIVERLGTGPRQVVLLVRVGTRLLVVHQGPEGAAALGEITDPEEVETLLGPDGPEADPVGALPGPDADGWIDASQLLAAAGAGAGVGSPAVTNRTRSVATESKPFAEVVAAAGSAVPGREGDRAWSRR